MKQTAVEWFSNAAYELFEQYSEGKFDRISLNKLMLEATVKAKEMEKEQMIDFARLCLNKAKDLDILSAFMNVQHYYLETYGGQDEL
jgi:hypothetical protein